MNQTQKRLNIIKLAISITDMETIQLQILKLSPLKHDREVQEIIQDLQAENFAKAQELITTYIETPIDEIVQRNLRETQKQKQEEDLATIEEFDLFVTNAGKKKEMSEDDLLDFTLKSAEESTQKGQQNIDFDTLLNIASEEVLPDNIELKVPKTPKDTFFDTPLTIQSVPKDTFFDESEMFEEPAEVPQEAAPETEKSVQEQKAETRLKDTPEIPKKSSSYEAITYIEQKLRNMITQYPPVEEGDETFPSVNAWLIKISNDGYTEEEVEEMIAFISKLKEENKTAEAAELLLITGATQSKFAQFMLARALFKGELLEKNIPESFTHIYRLAMDDNFPEAVCDLAQFYEHGIGTDKDKSKALALYKEAMELGINRAMKHYDRLQKQSKGLLSVFK